MVYLLNIFLFCNVAFEYPCTRVAHSARAVCVTHLVLHVKTQDSSWGTSFFWKIKKDFKEEKLHI